MADTVKIKKTRAPKKVTIDYHNGKIYKIVNDLNELIYIGSTTTTLARRFGWHKSASESRTSPFYTAMKQLGVDHFKIILIENFPSKSKDELEAREYALLNTFDKKIVYNRLFDGGKHSDETKQKMSDARFNRGSLIEYKNNGKYKNQCGFRFDWYENGEKQGKRFSYGAKRSREIAYLMCLDHQNQIYPLTTKDLLAELPFAE